MSPVASAVRPRSRCRIAEATGTRQRKRNLAGVQKRVVKFAPVEAGLLIVGGTARIVSGNRTAFDGIEEFLADWLHKRGRIARAAKLLGVHANTLTRLLAKLDSEPSEN